MSYILNDISEINKYCDLALKQDQDIVLNLSPSYQENNLNLKTKVSKIGGQGDDYRYIEIDISAAESDNCIYIIVKDKCDCR